MPSSSRHKPSRWLRWWPFRGKGKLRRYDPLPGTSAEVASAKDRIALTWALALGTVTAALLGGVIYFLSLR